MGGGETGGDASPLVFGQQYNLLFDGPPGTVFWYRCFIPGGYNKIQTNLSAVSPGITLEHGTG